MKDIYKKYMRTLNVNIVCDKTHTVKGIFERTIGGRMNIYHIFTDTFFNSFINNKMIYKWKCNL
jgi:hypothetical protein